MLKACLYICIYRIHEVAERALNAKSRCALTAFISFITVAKERGLGSRARCDRAHDVRMNHLLRISGGSKQAVCLLGSRHAPHRRPPVRPQGAQRAPLMPLSVQNVVQNGVAWGGVGGGMASGWRGSGGIDYFYEVLGTVLLKPTREHHSRQEPRQIERAFWCSRVGLSTFA